MSCLVLFTRYYGMKLISFLIFCVLAGCRIKVTPSIDAAAVAKSASSRFLENRSPEGCGTAPGCPDALRITREILGPFLSGTPEPIYGIGQGAGKKMILRSESRFANGSAKETFTWIIKGSQADLDAYSIEIDFDQLAIEQWQRFRRHLAAGSVNEACAMTSFPACAERLARASAVLGKAEPPEERFAGKITRLPLGPFPETVYLETRTRFAKGNVLENFDWELSREHGFRIARFDLAPAR